jgi:hypothetical protein
MGMGEALKNVKRKLLKSQTFANICSLRVKNGENTP